VADVGSITAPNQLYVDGQYIDIAHYPNSGFVKATADAPNKTSIISSDLTLSSSQVTGATVMAIAVSWRVSPSVISSYNESTQTISLASQLDGVMTKDWGFYLQNKLWMLDSAKEWYYNSSTGKIYLWTPNGDNPSSHTVEIAKRQYGLNISNNNHVTIQDLSFQRAMNDNVHVDSVNNVILKSVDVDGGLNGIHFSNSSNCSLNNNFVQNALDIGISVETNVSNINILNNYVNNSGNVGMPRTSIASVYIGEGQNINMKDNLVTNSGYDGILFSGDQIVLENNRIDKSCSVLTDCGGIYTGDSLCQPDLDPNHPSNNTITGNIVTNSIANTAGSGYSNGISHGIYLDSCTISTTVTNNIVDNVDYGMIIGDGHDNIVTGNKVYRARGYAFHISSAGLPSTYAIGGIARRNTVQNNVFDNSLATTAWSNSLLISRASPEAISLGDFDNNKYCSSKDYVFDTQTKGEPGDPGYYAPIGLNGLLYTLSEWQDFSGHDANSTFQKSSCAVSVSSPVLPSCGDSKCNARETCSSCPSDCGACIDEPGTFSLSISSTNGTVSKNPNQTTFEKGTNVILTANPNQGYKFKNWSGDASGSANPLTLTMTSAKTVTANFVKIEEEIEDEKKEEALIKAIIPPTSQFTKDLKLKDTNNDVLMLQQFLNNNGFTISVKGYGSKGNETIYFGAATQNALNKFQTQFLDKIGISSPTGYLDAKTRAFINLKVVSNTETDTTTTTPTTPISSSIPSDFKFSSTLKYGQNSQDILYLQKILNSDPYTRIAKTGVGSWGKETIHFGAATRAAVIKFQEKYAKEILTPSGLTRGTGTVGAATIKKLNQIVESRNY
jgi:parallel beta-helix repeat protein